MKTNVRESSIETYYGVLVPKQLQAQQSMILKTMARRKGWWSRRQVARATQLETSTVSARVNAMLAAGLLEESETADFYDDGTRMHVHGIRVAQKLRAVA